MNFLIVINILLFTTSFVFCDKNETSSEEDKEFLFRRPPVPQLLNRGSLGNPLTSLLGSSLSPFSSNFGLPQTFPTSFIGRTGVPSFSNSNPFLNGNGLGSPNFQNPLLTGNGIGSPSGINLPLLGLNGLRNPLLTGLSSFTPSNDFIVGNVPQNIQFLQRPLLDSNQVNGLNLPLFNPSLLNLLNQRNLNTRRELDQTNLLKRPSLLSLQQLQGLEDNTASSLDTLGQKNADDRLILQYLLGNTNLRNILGTQRQSRARENFNPESNGIQFPKRGSLPVSRTLTRLDD